MKPQTFRIHSQADLFSIPIETEGEVSFITLPVLPAGTFQHPSYGELSWTADKFGRMIANHEARVTGYEPMLNIDHATHNPFAAECPAYGWLKTLMVGEGGGLYARIELTDLGVEAIRSKRYRYTSAEVTGLYANSKGEEFQDVICGLALTNTPFHDTMPGTFSRPAADPEQVAQFAQLFSTLEGDLSFQEICCLVRDAVRAEVANVPGVYRYVEWDTVFPDFVIYEEWGYVGNREVEKHYKRAYTITNGAVTLATEVVEVEEVWVEKTQQAFAAARRQVELQRFGAQTPHQPADDPAKERKSMSQAQKPTFGGFIRSLFGLKPDATPEQLSAALDSAPAPAAEPAEDTPNDTQLSQPASAEVVALRQQVAAQQQAFAKLQEERAAEQLTLAKEKAEAAIQAYVSQGKITPAMLSGEGGTALREFARTQPDAFAALYNAAPQLVPLNKLGRAGEPVGDGAVTDAETFNGLVTRIQAENPGLELSAAIELAADQRPELYMATLPGRSN